MYDMLITTVYSPLIRKLYFHVSGIITSKIRICLKYFRVFFYQIGFRLDLINVNPSNFKC